MFVKLDERARLYIQNGMKLTGAPLEKKKRCIKKK